jgi:small subunit ribosomal protein S16
MFHIIVFHEKMLTIRLTRKGKKNQPFFRIVVIDKKRSSKGGRAVEEVGYINPLTKKNSLEKERILYWLSVGAQASPRVHNLLVAEKIVDAKKVTVFSLKKSAKAEALAKASAPVSQAKPAESGEPVTEKLIEEVASPEPEKPVA